MRKTFKLDEIDCAACATKLENAIRRIDGVQGASINFMLQKLTLEAVDERFEDVLNAVITLMAEIEPDCKIVG